MTVGYFVADDRKRGALSWQNIWDLARAGEIRADTLILLPGASEWQRACEIEHVRDFFPDALPPGLPASQRNAPAAAAPNPELAGPYSRLLARLIDYIIFVFVSMTVMLKTSIADLIPKEALGSWAPYVSVFHAYIGQSALMWLLVQLFLALCLGLTGTSPGKAILGLKVRSLKNQSPLQLHLVREAKIWVLVICLGFHAAAVFQLGRQYLLLRFGQPTIYDGKSAIVEGRPSAFRFALGIGTVLLLIATVLCVIVRVLGHLPFW
jgi:uncharacterized RDD family membrane protein YckC